MKLPTLYKKTKTGAVEEWQIEFDKNSYTITHGQVGGIKQSKSNAVRGKNTGKSNETSDKEQAESEAKSRWKKQLDKGYSQDVKNLDRVLPSPMLAHEFKKYGHKIEYPCYVQPKLDGVRCLAFIEDGRVRLLSRQGKDYSLPHIQDELLPILEKNIGLVLDGELYIHGVPFQSLVSWVKKQQPDSVKIEYHVYDCIMLSAFNLRNIELTCKLVNLFADDNSKIVGVETNLCKNEQEINEAHSRFTSIGYEGSIIRYGDKPYEVGYRSQNLLKLKDFMTEEFEVVGANECDNLPGMCKFVLKTIDGAIFEAMPEGDQDYRKQLFIDQDQYIGQMATVRFFEYTTTDPPVPRFPVLVEFRTYE